MKFSKAIIKIAKKNIKKFKKDTDKSFLIRQKLQRILDQI